MIVNNKAKIKSIEVLKNPMWILLIIFIVSACTTRPNFPDTPSISLNDYYFQQIKDLSLDSLVIKIKFEDGDGDLGLFSDEIYPPYQLLDINTDTNGDTLRFGDPNTPPYNCIDYEIFRSEESINGSLVVTADTVYVDRNIYHYNFLLYFLIKEADGSFREFSPALERNCAPPYHGRYFILNTAGDVRPLEGELQYNLVSGFRLLFRNEIIKLRIQIFDRALNESNIIETEEFNINDIIRPATD